MALHLVVPAGVYPRESGDGMTGKALCDLPDKFSGWEGTAGSRMTMQLLTEEKGHEREI